MRMPVHSPVLKVDACGTKLAPKGIINKKIRNYISDNNKANFQYIQSEGFGDETGCIRLASRNFKVNSTRGALVFSLMVMASSHALAVKVWEGIEAEFNGAVTWGTQIRTESPNPGVYAYWPSKAVPGMAKGNLQGQTGGSDLNFRKGDAISTVIKAVWDLDLNNGNIGLFVRGRAWDDLALGEKNAAYGHYPNGFQPNQPLSDRGFASSAKFSQVEFREAFVYGQVEAGTDTPLKLRLGRQVLSWGGSLLSMGSVSSAINPTDMASLLQPGALPSEGRLPVGMLSAQWASGPLWRLEGFAAYESRSTVLPGCGTYFDLQSFAPAGCNFAALAGASEQSLLASGAYLHRNADVKAASTGAYGVLLGYKAEPWDADFKFFAMNTHSANPSLRMTINALTPGVQSVSYAMVYPEDLSLLGLSFSKKITPTTRLLGEVAYVPHQPVTLNAYDVLNSFVMRSPVSVLALNKSITTLPVGASFDAYDRFGVVTATLGVDTVFPKILGAERLNLLAEVGVSQVRGLPDPSILRYGRPLAYNGAAYAGGPACVDAVPGKTCNTDGYVSPSAWGFKILASARYAPAGSGLTWTPSLLLTKDVKGYAHDGTYSQGRTLLRPALRAEFGQRYFGEIQYHRYSGGPYNLLIDRDHVGLVAGARF